MALNLFCSLACDLCGCIVVKPVLVTYSKTTYSACQYFYIGFQKILFFSTLVSMGKLRIFQLITEIAPKILKMGF